MNCTSENQYDKDLQFWLQRQERLSNQPPLCGEVQTSHGSAPSVQPKTAFHISPNPYHTAGSAKLCSPRSPLQDLAVGNKRNQHWPAAGGKSNLDSYKRLLELAGLREDVEGTLHRCQVQLQVLDQAAQEQQIQALQALQQRHSAVSRQVVSQQEQLRDVLQDIDKLAQEYSTTLNCTSDEEQLLPLQARQKRLQLRVQQHVQQAEKVLLGDLGLHRVKQNGDEGTDQGGSDLQSEVGTLRNHVTEQQQELQSLQRQLEAAREEAEKLRRQLQGQAAASQQQLSNALSSLQSSMDAQLQRMQSLLASQQINYQQLLDHQARQYRVLQEANFAATNAAHYPTTAHNWTTDAQHSHSHSYEHIPQQRSSSRAANDTHGRENAHGQYRGNAERGRTSPSRQHVAVRSPQRSRSASPTRRGVSPSRGVSPIRAARRDITPISQAKSPLRQPKPALSPIRGPVRGPLRSPVRAPAGVSPSRRAHVQTSPARSPNTRQPVSSRGGSPVRGALKGARHLDAYIAHSPRPVSPTRRTASPSRAASPGRTQATTGRGQEAFEKGGVRSSTSSNLHELPAGGTQMSPRAVMQHAQQRLGDVSPQKRVNTVQADANRKKGQSSLQALVEGAHEGPYEVPQSIESSPGGPEGSPLSPLEALAQWMQENNAGAAPGPLQKGAPKGPSGIRSSPIPPADIPSATKPSQSRQHNSSKIVPRRLDVTAEAPGREHTATTVTAKPLPGTGVSMTNARCVKCGILQRDARALSECRFHPALLPEPGTLKFTPQWYACKRAGHTAQQPGCFVRKQHYFVS